MPQAEKGGTRAGDRRQPRRTTIKLHALSDERGQQGAFVLTGVQAAKFRAAEALLAMLPRNVLVIADLGYELRGVRGDQRPRFDGGHSAQDQLRLQATVQPRVVPSAKRHRADVRSAEGLPPDRQPLATVCYWS